MRVAFELPTDCHREGGREEREGGGRERARARNAEAAAAVAAAVLQQQREALRARRASGSRSAQRLRAARGGRQRGTGTESGSGSTRGKERRDPRVAMGSGAGGFEPAVLYPSCPVRGCEESGESGSSRDGRRPGAVSRHKADRGRRRGVLNARWLFLGVGGGGQEAMGVVGTRGFCARFLNNERRPAVSGSRWELGAGRGRSLWGRQSDGSLPGGTSRHRARDAVVGGWVYRGTGGCAAPAPGSHPGVP